MALESGDQFTKQIPRLYEVTLTEILALLPRTYSIDPVCGDSEI